MVIAVFVILLIILTILFSSSQLTEAYIDQGTLRDAGWFEDRTEKYYEEQLLGLEKQVSYTYKNEDIVYPSYISVTSMKTLFMLSESDLLDKTVETIEEAMQRDGIVLDGSSEVSAHRVLNNEHKSLYIIYNGTFTINNVTEKIMVIGENWNCGVSGTSVICIGFAQITNSTNSNPGENLTYWAKIVKDEMGTFFGNYGSTDFLGTDGLIYNVKCH